MLLIPRRRYKENNTFHSANPYFEDFVKITGSNAFKRLAYKTQAISLPETPHISTRQVHTIEVINLSMRIALLLGLNRELCMAIAAGHDIGHVPYGHLGERALTDLGKKRYGDNYKFRHNIFSVIVAQHIEKLNLTKDTLKGMFLHSRGSGELTVNQGLPQEFNVVMFADKIAYMFSDLEDAMSAELIDEASLPESVKNLGSTVEERRNKVIHALIEESKRKGYVVFSEGPIFEDFDKLKKFMYEQIYPGCDRYHQVDSIKRICEFFAQREEFKGVDPLLIFALLTDKEVFDLGVMLLKPRKIKKSEIEKLSVFEYLDDLKGKQLDCRDVDLDW